jgi:hypothetical protein
MKSIIKPTIIFLILFSIFTAYVVLAPLRFSESIGSVEEKYKNTIEIPPLTYKYIIININKPIAFLHIKFTASGGLSNDLIVRIMNNDSFINWKNGHYARPIYDSGKVTTDSIAIAGVFGTYVVVFDNTFSFFSAKIVKIEIYASSF